MKLKDYALRIQELAQTYPDVDVIYSLDDEGNCFSKVMYAPCVGTFSHNEFVPDDSSEETKEKINSVCLN